MMLSTKQLHVPREVLVKIKRSPVCEAQPVMRSAIRNLQMKLQSFDCPANRAAPAELRFDDLTQLAGTFTS